MFPTIQLGPLSFPVPALALLVSVWLVLSLTEKNASLYGLEAEKLNNLSLTAMISGIAGARLVFIARYPDAFLESPASIVSLNPGLLDLWGGILFGLIAAFGYGQRKGLKLLPTLDAFTPGFAVLAVGIAIAHLASGNAFGMPANIPWAIELWGARRHPTQAYEILLSLGILGLIWNQKKRTRHKEGYVFFLFTALTAGSRLFLEAYRGDSLLLSGGIRGIQIAAWIILAAALYFIFNSGARKADG